jgi:hypothetical protein
MLGILGSGFGLYGYLPAIIESDFDNVVLPIALKGNLTSRSELKSYANSIIWVENRDVMLESVDTLVLAVPPHQQVMIVKDLLNKRLNNIDKLFLEKPPATDYSESIALLSELKESHLKFRIAYTFPFCMWFDTLRTFIEENNTSDLKINIEWVFNAYYLQYQPNSWKAFSKEGGGVLNFYGIHILSVFVMLGFNILKHSFLYCEKVGRPILWHAEFKNSLGAKVSIRIDCNSSSEKFKIESYSNGNFTMVDLLNPFEDELNYNNQDKRVSGLMKYIHTMNLNNEIYSYYDSINLIWKETIVNTEYLEP